MEKVFSPFLFPFRERFVAQIAEFIQIGDFDETLRFAFDMYPFNSFRTVNFLQLFGGYVKYAALTDVDGFVLFKRELGD